MVASTPSNPVSASPAHTTRPSLVRNSTRTAPPAGRPSGAPASLASCAGPRGPNKRSRTVVARAGIRTSTCPCALGTTAGSVNVTTAGSPALMLSVRAISGAGSVPRCGPRRADAIAWRRTHQLPYALRRTSTTTATHRCHSGGESRWGPRSGVGTTFHYSTRQGLDLSGTRPIWPWCAPAESRVATASAPATPTSSIRTYSRAR